MITGNVLTTGHLSEQINKVGVVRGFCISILMNTEKKNKEINSWYAKHLLF